MLFLLRALPIDVRRSSASPACLNKTPAALPPILYAQKSGGVAAKSLGSLPEKHSFSANRTA